MEREVRLIEDETVRIDDGRDYTSAILRRCQILYTGGRLFTENALFFDCTFGVEDGGVHFQTLQRTIFRSLYAQGQRTLIIDKDGDYQAV